MKVKRNSWHYRLFRWTLPDSQKDEIPSACEYMGKLIALPLLSPFFVAVMLVVFPLVWIGDKLEGKVRCPIGKIVLVDEN